MKLLTKPVNIVEVRMEEGNIFFNETVQLKSYCKM